MNVRKPYLWLPNLYALGVSSVKIWVKGISPHFNLSVLGGFVPETNQFIYTVICCRQNKPNLK